MRRPINFSSINSSLKTTTRSGMPIKSDRCNKNNTSNDSKCKHNVVYTIIGGSINRR